MTQCRVFTGLHRLIIPELQKIGDDHRTSGRTQDLGQLGGIHMLGRIDTKTCHAPFTQLLEMVGQQLLYPYRAGIQIGKPTQIVLLDLLTAGVIGQLALTVEICRLELGIEIGGGVELATGRPGATAQRHMV